MSWINSRLSLSIAQALFTLSCSPPLPSCIQGGSLAASPNDFSVHNAAILLAKDDYWTYLPAEPLGLFRMAIDSPSMTALQL
ncbi:uncharacterized protein BXZ73DRAFT_99901 [Epithele typhae]|uniref:uncharacterized protein n=1 Tax=Epithele typhae TaxID=378194 RepID=UPI0020076A49|nr:uncharacterized protein BXZ73DRAFT_99901 [Epithele typhae]KAH9938843.1 hypothetical protein BXZ73DRAFT_99901 [Epithele typhae]